MTALSLLSRSTVTFPPVDKALRDPNGLLAMGGSLEPEWLLAAYQHGIFPWFNEEDGPILWWSPDPRGVLYLDELKVSRSLAKRIRNGGFSATMDLAFADVVAACAERRAYADGTWITGSMQQAYVALHRLGFAHSVEIWLDGRLVGGLYGVSIGRMFFGESMFTRERDASKVALYYLVRQLQAWKFTLIDCQMMNEHLSSLGAREIPRETFVELLEDNAAEPTRCGPWRLEIAGQTAEEAP